MVSIYVAWFFQFSALFFTRSELRYVAIVNLLFSFYLCLLAPGFWVNDGLVFVGLSFHPPSFLLSVLPLAISFSIFSILLALLSHSSPVRKLFLTLSSVENRPYINLSTCSVLISLQLTLTLLSFILGISSSVSKFIYQILDSSTVLVFYLFSARRFKLGTLAASSFALYSLYTGFRYKILFLILAVLPLFTPSLSYAKLHFIRKHLFKVILLLFFGCFVLLLLAAMTITRSKFSDASFFQNLIQAYLLVTTSNISDILGYPLFAESNILFANYVVMFYDHELSFSEFLHRFIVSFQSYLLVLLPSFLKLGSQNFSIYTDILNLFGNIEGANSATAFSLVSYLTYIYSSPHSFFVFVVATIVLFIALLVCSVVAVRSSYSFTIAIPGGTVVSLSGLLFLSLMGPASYLFFFRGNGPEAFKFMFVLCTSALVLGRLALKKRRVSQLHLD
jgi:hypothetical protein